VQIQKTIQFLVLSLFLISCEIKFSNGDFKPHVYLNWRSEDTFTTIQVNYHTKGNFSQATVYYDTESRGGNPALYTYKTTGHTIKWPGTDRAVHHVELTSLTPGKPYYFITGDEKSGFTPERKFRTLDPMDSNLKIANGGDMGTGKRYATITELAATYDPDVVLLGGDIAYADGNPKNTGDWDKWLSVWTEKMVTSDGFTVPFILAIGNHETNLLKIFAKPEEKAPFYYSLFDQDAKGRSYFTRKISNDIMLFVLDSTHIYAPFGKQRVWLREQMEKYKTMRTKIAIYHVGLYPSHRAYNDPLNLLGRLSWLKIFDHYRIDLSLEHHDHTMKRTKYLRNNNVKTEGLGTLYLGDGAWGKQGRDVKRDRWYLERAEETTHFWLLEAKEDVIEMTAIDDEGKIFDTHSMFRLPEDSLLLHENSFAVFADDTNELLESIGKNKELAPYLQMLENE
jgi:hypothetical protein